MEDGALLVRLPIHWARADQEAALARFRRWAIRRQVELSTLPPPVDRAPLSELDLWRMVQRINEQTVQVAVLGVRIGKARRTRLAQANCQTGVLTFSRFAIDGLPDRALRYLILHELTHLRIPDHSARFWATVARFEPDWRRMRKLAQAHFERAVASRGPLGRPLAFQAAEAARLPFDAVFGRGGTEEPANPAGALKAPEAANSHRETACSDREEGPGVQLPLFPGLVPEYEID